MSGDMLSGSTRAIGTVVRPQKVTADKTVVQSVVDFFNDVLPQGSVPHKANDKEVVAWVRIDQPERLGDISDPHSPIYLSFGYANGVQIWAIEPHGEAWEVFSSRQAPVKILRLLPFPEEVMGAGDAFEEKRPLIAVCDSSPASSHPCTTLSIISLRTGEKVHNVKFRTAIEEVYCNQRVIVVTFPDRLVVLDACTFKERIYVNASFPVQLVSPNPVALGKRWLAYSESKLHDMYHSLGGRMVDGVPSYTASVISAAKTISQGITNISEVVASSIAGTKKFTASSNFIAAPQEGKQEGVITVIDIGMIGDGEISLEKGSVNRIGVVAHFLAHSSSNVAAVSFSVDGTLLLSASQTGQHFHIFRMQPHPAGSSMTIVQHLYILHRGDTNATIQDIAFSLDSRWVAVTSLRATTHVFPITPYGGPITCRTHSSPRVVNKASRFIKSAGLDELEAVPQNGVPPVSAASTGSASPRYMDSARLQVQSPPSASTYTPSSVGMPQFRPPVVVQPLIQIKHSGAAKTAHSNHSMVPSKNVPVANDTVRVAACFAARRSRASKETSVCDALLIGTSHGALVEYSLQPVVSSQTERATDEAPVGLSIHAQSQWILNRHLSHAELIPPFLDNHPLLNSPALSLKRRMPDDGQGYQENNSPDRVTIVNIGTGGSENEAWLSQVEIVTNAGPARRLWMGPQFRFTPLTSPNAPSSIPLSSFAQAEIMRTGSDWDLSDLKLANLRVRSAPINLPHTSGSSYSLTIEAGSGSVEKLGATDCISRDCNSCDDLRVSEIADAMAEVVGKDVMEGIHVRLKGLNDFDESPEDLSVSSAESNQSGGPHPLTQLSVGAPFPTQPPLSSADFELPLPLHPPVEINDLPMVT